MTTNLLHTGLLKAIVSIYPYMQKTGNFYNAFEAMHQLNKASVDLIFLDINMPKLSGFDLLKTLQHPPQIIVTSAYKEFALEGYELNISDYLLKPFSFERFLKAVNKSIQVQLTNTEPPMAGKAQLSFFLKGDKKIHQIHAADILFIEAYGNYTKVYSRQEMIISHEKISALENLLPKEDFIRVHKSFIVAIQKIKMIEGNRISIDDHYIPIGQTYKNNLKRLY